MTQLIVSALIDAIGWQDGLADAYGRGTPDYAKAKEQAARYRAALKRRTGSSQTPAEIRMAKMTPVTLEEIARRNNTKDSKAGLADATPNGSAPAGEERT